MPNGEQPNAAELSHSHVDENEADYIITNDETDYAGHAARSRNERLNDDVTKRNAGSEATRNEESDWPNPAVSPKTREKSSPNTDEKPKNDENFLKKTLATENDAQNSPDRGMILSCPKYLKTMPEMKVRAPEEGNTISVLILIQTTQKTLDTRKG